MEPATMAMLGISGANLLRSLFSGGDDDKAGPFDKELRELLQMQTGQLRQSEPLRQAILQMAMRLVPGGMMGGGPLGMPPQSGARMPPMAGGRMPPPNNGY